MTRGDFRPRHFVTLASSAPGSARDLTYDQIGNPLNYRDGFSFKWSGGRKLTSVKLDNGSVYMTGEYRYDDNGIRTYKEVNGNVTKYYLNGSTILTEETNYGGATRRIDYVYDENGSVYGFSVGGNKYYYQKNLQGDVIGILDKDGDLLVKYVYDAYGVPTTSFPGITSSMSASEKQDIYILGSNNPFRYRGYYFDTETGFYYLNSRYYDPVTGRFLNADGQIDNRGCITQNLFSYCGNNPIRYVDPSGEAWWVVCLVIAGCAIVGGILGAQSDTKLGENINSQAEPQEVYDSGKEQNETNPQNLVITTPQKQNDSAQKETVNELTVGDRVVNTLIGAGLGLAVGGMLVATGGAIGSVLAGSATTVLPVLGTTGAQAFAIGALSYNVLPILMAPFFDIELDPIEN